MSELKDKIAYCWSLNKEDFFGEFATRKEALAAARENTKDPDDAVYTARGVWFPSSAMVVLDIDDMLESMAEVAWDRCGDAVTGDWPPNVTPEAKAKVADALKEALAGWADKHIPAPTFCAAEDIEEHQP